MTLLVWILRILVLFIIIRFVVLMVRNALAVSGSRTSGARPRVKKQPERLGGTLVQDPHCGTYLPVDRAITVERGGSLQHFCSTTCRDEWQGGATR